LKRGVKRNGDQQLRIPIRRGLKGGKGRARKKREDQKQGCFKWSS